jgi:Flp pilus assembly pilin Flp
MSELARKMDALKAFHNDEDGLETVQVVMIIAIAAVVLIALIKFWDEIKTWVKGIFGTLKSDSSSGQQW